MRRLCGSLVAVVLAASTVVAQIDGPARRITSASAVRVRSAPNTTASVVDTLSIGVLVEEVGRTPTKSRVGQQEDWWYQVALPGGKRGWVFGALTRPVPPGPVDDVHVAIAKDRIAKEPEQLSFTDWTDLVAWLGRATAAARDRDGAGELELARLQAIRKAIDSVPHERREEASYAKWIAAQGDALVYSDPAGSHFVATEQFWNAQRKYRDLAVGERIAYAAAGNPLPGECEGYWPCYVSGWNQMGGRYLEAYPRGKAAGEMLDSLVEVLGGENNTMPEDAEERADMLRCLEETRRILQGVAGPRKTEALRLVEKIETACRQ